MAACAAVALTQIGRRDHCTPDALPGATLNIMRDAAYLYMEGFMSDLDPNGPLALPHADDDATKINDLYTEETAPPAPEDLPEAATAPTPAPPPPGNNRLMSAAVVLSSGEAGYQLVKFDPARFELHVWASSDTLTDYVTLADNLPTLTSNDSTAARLFSGQELVFKEYTGPLWVAVPSTITGPITVYYAAVTR